MRSIFVVPAQAGGNSGVKREAVGGVVGGTVGRVVGSRGGGVGVEGRLGCAYLVGIAGVGTVFSLVTA